MSKFFNTAGPIMEDDHYFIPVFHRINLDEILTLIDQKKYFVLHAPRQSGKTTTLLELCSLLNKSGRYKCLYINVESAQTSRENVEQAMRILANVLVDMERDTFEETSIKKHFQETLTNAPANAFEILISQWARESQRPTVLLIDEIDSLVGDTLVSLLRQIRRGYASRPKNFPQSILLCGVRDVRDYRMHTSSEQSPVTGGSAFNILSKSLTVGPFSFSEVQDLYRQHTKATGQRFADDAVELAFHLTNGQPWLVNALAYEACFENPLGKDRSHVITADMMTAAKESLILRRVTHLDQLADKLNEPRVRAVIEPMILGGLADHVHQDHLDYVIDLGLVSDTPRGLDIANPIYKEVIPRQLTFLNQTQLKSVVSRQWFINPDGSIAVEKLLRDFQQFFRENSESWIQRFEPYQEAGPQLLLQAYLQRVVNGGGRIDREYGLGRGRTDILLTWPYESSNKDTLLQKVVLELKILRGSKKKTLDEGLEQTKKYLEQVGYKEGHLLIFNSDKKTSWTKKIYREVHVHKGCSITVWGL